MAAVEVRRKGRHFLLNVLAACGTVLLVLAFLVSVVETAAFDPAYYEREYTKNGTATYVGVSEETLNEATTALLEYLEGNRASLDMEADVRGETREYYNEREKLHMADVRDLNMGALAFMWTGYIAGGIFLGIAFVLSENRRSVCRAVFGSVVGVLAAFAAIGIWGAADFTSFWVSFHHVFFRNDLWMFDPAQSLLIRMFEEQFFYDLVGQILRVFLIVMAVVLVVTWILGWKKKRRKTLGSAPA